MGSIDFTAACRSVLLAGHDPDSRENRAIVQIKSNLGPLADPIGYTIGDGLFRWTGETELTASRILAPETEDSSLTEAKTFLRHMLGDGSVLANKVKEEAKANGISEATLRRAMKAINVKRDCKLNCVTGNQALL
jgi:hypothetical protein